MQCPACGTDSDGNFCPGCGASLRASNCGRCGAKLVPGARFCTQCGTASGVVPRGDASGSTMLPWYLAGGVLLLLALVLIVPMFTGSDTGGTGSAAPFAAPGPMQGGAPGAPAGTPPPLTGTPREQADRLFNRIMAAREQGDTASVLFFAPMGIQAYENARPLDYDGLYHLATIQNAAGDHAAARATAEEILAQRPTHLLGLAAAAAATDAAGDAAAARDYHARFLDAWDAEVASGLGEYEDHATMLPRYRDIARQATGG